MGAQLLRRAERPLQGVFGLLVSVLALSALFTTISGIGSFIVYHAPAWTPCQQQPQKGWPRLGTAGQHPLDLPWPPLLKREELLRGLTYYGTGDRLHAVAAKLLAGQPIKVFTLGGSVTGGGGAFVGRKTSYVARFFNFINATFPHSEHVLVNKAISASTAILYSTCLQHHVPLDADLVTLEFTVNERKDAPFSSTERRSFEQLIRRLLQYPGRPAIIMLHHYSWYESVGDGVDRGLFYQEPEAQLTTFAHYYDLPSVSVRAATHHLMGAGVQHFKVDKVAGKNTVHLYGENGTEQAGTIPTAPPARQAQLNFFYVDRLHPFDPGHQTLAELLVQPLIRAVREVEAGQALQEEDRRQSHKLKGMLPPMIPDNLDEEPGVCAMMEDFKAMVVEQQGFEYLPERPNATDFMHQKWGWRGTEPGAWAELELDTQAGWQDGGTGSTFLWLSHLRSYQGMGTALIECRANCECSPTVLDGTWKTRVSLFWMTRFAVTRHPQCRIRVTVSDKPGESAGDGHKVTLVGVMVTHVPLDGAGSLANVQPLEYI